MRLIALISALFIITMPLCAMAGGPAETGEDSAMRTAEDAAAILVFRNGLARVLDYVDSNPGIFSPEPTDGEVYLPTRAEKEQLWSSWKTVLDYSLALESISQYHKGFLKLDDGQQREASFLVHYASFLAQYRFALDFLTRLDGHPAADTILNEAVPELGLDTRTFARYKFRFLNVAAATEFASYEMLLKTFRKGRLPALRKVIGEDSAVVWRMGKGSGEEMTLKNAMVVIRDTGLRAWLPVQKGVSQWMGDVKVRRRGQYLISQELIRTIRSRLRPGDVLLERREWYLSNVGLPGFWTHAALYVGTAEERASYFVDEGVSDWVREQGEESGDLEKLLLARYPEACRMSRSTAADGHRPRVLEAVGEGVIFTTIEHSAAADSVVVLRPRLSKKDKAVALVRAFHYSGRPYDFDFDFTTDSALVCSELVFKAYEPSAGCRGLRLRLVDLMGRVVSPPNEMARQFDEEFGREEQQLEMVLFLDGQEKAGQAVESSLTEFRRSWQRPKWHILVQDDPPADQGD